MPKARDESIEAGGPVRRPLEKMMDQLRTAMLAGAIVTAGSATCEKEKMDPRTD